jgi:hypothetical protein
MALICAAGLFTVPVSIVGRAQPDDPPLPDAVGAIEGEAITVQGPMSMDTANGQVKTILRSGGDIVVKSGVAHIQLVEGGSLSICGPAHFSVLKSGNALTIALDSGTIHAQIEGQLTLNIYTAQIQAHPISIGGGPQDVLVGLDSKGAMCIRAAKGAVRIEQQLTGQNLLIPQNGDVSLTNGQLESLQTAGGHCVCDMPLVANPAPVVTELSTLATSEEFKKKPEDPKPETPPLVQPLQTEEPIYQVIMPPLRYDAGAKIQQDYDPNLIILVRRARVRPTLIFQGMVEGDPVMAKTARSSRGPVAGKPVTPDKPADDTTWNHVRTFFHKLWSPSS